MEQGIFTLRRKFMCNCNNGIGCALMGGISNAISNLFSTAPYCGNNNTGCGCNGNNNTGCGCNGNNNTGCGCNGNNNTGCGCMAYDPYYMQQYGLPIGTGCGCGCSGT